MRDLDRQISAPFRAALATLLAASGAEAILAWLVWSGHTSIVVGFAGHAAVLAGLILIGSHTFRRDYTTLWLAVVAVGVAGPLGSLGATLQFAILSYMRVPGADMQAWYQRLAGSHDNSEAVELYDRIVQDRSFRAGRHEIEYLPELLEGSLTRQQSLLGLIGLDFHPEYGSLLQQALRSTEPSIRAHAAAVSVKLRAGAKNDIRSARRDLSMCDASPKKIEAAIRLMRRAALSGFLEEQERLASLVEALTYARGLSGQVGSADVDALVVQLVADLGRWQEVRSRAAPSTRAVQLSTRSQYLESLMETGETLALSEALRLNSDQGLGIGIGHAT